MAIFMRASDAVDPRVITVGFAIVSTCLLSFSQTDEVIPFGDGVGFSKRAIELHGLLHSGQLSAFVQLLTSPSTFTLLPTYLLFFLVPTAWATGATYGVITCLVWNLAMALGLLGILKLLGRPQLAPWLFLLTAANNYALDDNYYYYMDLPFAGWALLAIWLQALAWQRQRGGLSFAAGLMAGSLFLVKPANAFLFVLLFVVAEAIHAAWQCFANSPIGSKTPRVTGHLLAVAGGLGAAVMVALPLGLLQVIASRMSAMQEDLARTVLDCGPVLRLMYFPLCMTYYYSALVLAVLAVIGVAIVGQQRLLAAVFKRDTPPHTASPSPNYGLMVSLATSYVLLWGFAFSFALPAKVIRSLPLMIPLLWIMASELPPIRRLPSWVVAGFAATYFCIAHLQALTGVIPKTNRIAENYLLVDDWFNRLPGRRDLEHAGIRISKDILKAMDDLGVKEGRIANGTEMMFWTATSLNWLTQIEDLRCGRRPSREFATACDNRGHPIESALDGAHALLLVVHPSLQYSQGVYEFNTKAVNYALRAWKDEEAREIRVFSAGDGNPLMVVVVFQDRLSKKSLDTMMRSEFPQGFSTFAALEQDFEKPKTWSECLNLILRRDTR